MACQYNGAECGTWAGYKNSCCLASSVSSVENFTCADAAAYLSTFDLNTGGTPGIEASRDSDGNGCPSGTNYRTGALSGAAGVGYNVTCCDITGDMVTFSKDQALTIPDVARCIPRQGEDSTSNTGGSSTTPSTVAPTSNGAAAPSGTNKSAMSKTEFSYMLSLGMVTFVSLNFVV
ncbi:hypothetical protein ABW20_dc0107546 [Dactylellina cionopaga]|nr:hypothetical protein ABW20_dc0107546 [Dactylellina cionopaga]